MVIGPAGQQKHVRVIIIIIIIIIIVYGMPSVL